jgi:hypothetical protein
MAQKKGQTGNPNGRPKGTPNRTTKEAKELLETIMFGQLDNITEALELIKANDPSKYIESCAKLFTYVLPKKTDVTSGGESLSPTTIIFNRHGNTSK